MSHRSLALIVAFAATGLAGRAHARVGEMDRDHYLFPGQQLQSNCYSRVVYQGDGNLVIYDFRGHAGWSSGTQGKPGFVAMQGDGNLVVYDWNYNAVWTSGTSRYANSYAMMAGDGNFIVYDSGGHARWNSHTSGFYEQSGVGVEIDPCNAYNEEMSIFHGYNLPGNDYSHFVMGSAPATAEACAAACADDSPTCAAFTYVPAGVQNSRPVCWLKSVAAGNWEAATGMSSGTREIQTLDNGNQ